MQTHLFHDRVMRMEPWSCATGATLGPHGVILPAATIGAHATVGPASLVMRGESVPGRHPLDRQPDRRPWAPAQRVSAVRTAGCSTERRASRVRPLLPGHGDAGYRVHHYDLDARLPAGAQPARRRRRRHRRGRAPRAAHPVRPRPRPACRSRKVLVDGAAGRSFTHRGGKLTDPAGRAGRGRRRVHRRGALRRQPEPVAQPWGELGWEELTDGVLVASQPNGAPSWFPCNDRPGRQGDVPDLGHHGVRRTRWSPTAS